MKAMQEIRDAEILRISLAGWTLDNHESPNNKWTWKGSHPFMGKVVATERENNMAFNAMLYQIDLRTLHQSS